MTREEKQKAIDALKISAPVMAVTQEEFNDYIQTLNQVMDWLEQEPKTGRWITTRTFMHDGEFYCDKCKCEAPNNEKWDYCPNCGAKMQAESEEV